MNVRKTNEKGFTIIEVVLVLAIAALIFLMVFIALPALQRGQRDTQRKNDMGRVQTAIQNYQSNNRNVLPTFDATFISSYLTVGGDKFQDPDGTPYAFTATSNPTVFKAGDVRYTLKAACSGETVSLKDAAGNNYGASKVAIQYKLEGGGVSCVNN